MVETPELDRQHAVMSDAHVLSEFYDWLQSQGVHLMRWRTDLPDERRCTTLACNEGKIYNRRKHAVEDCSSCDGTGWRTITVEGWVHDGRSPQQLLADYFKIDLDKIEAERRALLADIRTQNG
jgi:hypothetical protein